MVSAANEMFLVVIPESLTTEKPLCVFWQWNKKSDENTKERLIAWSRSSLPGFKY